MMMVHKLFILCLLVVATLGQSSSPETPTSGPTLDPYTGVPTSDPTQDPYTGVPTSDSTQDPSTGVPTSDSTPDPYTGVPTSDPTQDPYTGVPTSDSTQDPSTGVPTSDSTPDPYTGVPTSDPTQDPYTGVPTSDSTQDPSTGSTNVTTAEPTDSATTPPIEDPCVPNPCGDESTCEARYNGTFICLCPSGQNYDEIEDICENARVFPGFLSLTSTYVKGMEDPETKVFKDTAESIEKGLKAGFSNETETYLGSRVLKLSPRAAGATLWSTRSSKLVNATVEHIFTPASNITDEQVKEGVDKAIGLCKNEDCGIGGAAFTATSLCARSPCDTNTTRCTLDNGALTCNCEDGYVKTEFSHKMCKACPSGKKAEGDSKCVSCPFGYSGFNCNESWKLSLVIVGSVLGGLLLITLILLPVVACKPSKQEKKSKKSEEAGIENAYISHSPVKAPLPNNVLASAKAAYANAGVPKIPRAMANNNGWDRSSNLEMTESNSRQNLVTKGNSQMYEDIDDTRSFNTKTPYAQIRVQTNPYAQSRGQTNPYAQSRGQANPYYMHDNGQRLN